MTEWARLIAAAGRCRHAATELSARSFVSSFHAIQSVTYHCMAQSDQPLALFLISRSVMFQLEVSDTATTHSHHHYNALVL